LGASPGPGGLASPAGCLGRVGDPRGALLRHPLVLQGLVLLLVLDAWSFPRHLASSRFERSELVERKGSPSQTRPLLTEPLASHRARKLMGFREGRASRLGCCPSEGRIHRPRA